MFSLYFVTSVQGPAQGDLINILDVSADGQTIGQLGNLDPLGFGNLCNVAGNHFAVNSRIGGDNDFTNLPFLQDVK